MQHPIVTQALKHLACEVSNTSALVFGLLSEVVKGAKMEGPKQGNEMDYSDVLKILNDLLEQADECEAASGEKPTAQEALRWAIAAVEDLTPQSIR